MEKNQRKSPRRNASYRAELSEGGGRVIAVLLMPPLGSTVFKVRLELSRQMNLVNPPTFHLQLYSRDEFCQSRQFINASHINHN